jgi:hypothetical protein
MKQPYENTALRTITIRETTYNTLTLIAKRENLFNDMGKASMRDVVAYLVQNYGDKIA